MNNRDGFARGLAAAALTALLLAGCGGSSPSPSSSGAEIIGPVILDAATTTAEVDAGRMVVFALDDPTVWTIAADKPELVTVKQGGTDGGATFNPGVVTNAPGVVVVTATKSDGTTLIFTITIK